ncbi:MAG TPA: hypothetical protein VMU61_00525 [Candidatus Aquilonibacter sp.]|nr:hypothetical protein [Candidatus Aquilonibacter sp.]
MSENAKFLYSALWIAHPLLEAAIATVMIRRSLYRKFKFFFAYLCAEIGSFALLYPAYVHHSYATFFYLYWATNAIGVFLGFMVIHEVFLDVFRPFHTLRDLGTVLFKWAGLVMLLVAGVVSVSSGSSNITPWMQAIVTTQRCVRIIQVGMVLFLLVFARYLGVSRRQHSFGIALGFGCYAMVELALIASWAGNHLAGGSIDLVNVIAYNAALLTWLGYMLAVSPVRAATENLLQPQRWEQSLADIHHPLPSDSLIPMFEGMVDRALSRTQPSPVLSGSSDQTSEHETAGSQLEFSGFSQRRLGSRSVTAGKLR